MNIVGIELSQNTWIITTVQGNVQLYLTVLPIQPYTSIYLGTAYSVTNTDTLPIHLHDTNTFT